MTDKELYMKAVDAMGNSYAPYSGFNVGAAVLTEDGKVFTGGNIENSAYGVTICAERVAVSKAISEGHRQFKAIAVVSNEGYSFPCGTCRQFMYEFGGEMRIIVGKDKDHLESYTLDELLPHGFRLENK
jgi:cytidine deaminase